jgi:hypothetical protein
MEKTKNMHFKLFSLLFEISLLFTFVETEHSMWPQYPGNND